MWSAFRSQVGVPVGDGEVAVWAPREAAILRGLCLGSDGCEAAMR